MRLPIIFILLTAGTLTGFAQEPNGHVNGEVWFRPFIENRNVFDNVHLPNCEIAFRSKSFQKKVVSDGGGQYEADLPAGIYTATTICAMTPDNSVYYPAARSEFEVKAGSRSLINLMVLTKYIKGSKDRKSLQPEYRNVDLKPELLQAKTNTGETRKIMVRYARRLSSKELAEYQGKRDYRQDTPVSLTYNALAIYADTITIEKPAMHIRAVGHVMVEDGKQRRQGTEVTVELDAADPIATLKLKD